MRLARLTLLAVAAGAAYWRGLRGAVLTWGATEEEATSRLPGDELLEAADGVATRAITINTSAAAVWPWLVQMGPSPRGGAYTYDWIENLLGLNMHSADQVLLEFQHPQIGDTISYGTNRMRLELVSPERAFVWRSADGDWVWSFVLREKCGVTRLISRNRFRLPTLSARAGMLLMEPASLIMERKMLLGIKERAERLAAAGQLSAGDDVDGVYPEGGVDRRGTSVGADEGMAVMHGCRGDQRVVQRAASDAVVDRSP